MVVKCQQQENQGEEDLELLALYFQHFCGFKITKKQIARKQIAYPLLWSHEK